MYQEEPIETIEISDDCVVKLYPDWDAGNPREEWDHAGHLVIKSRDYDLTDKGASVPTCRMSWEDDSWRFAQTYIEIMLHGVAVPVQFADYGSSGARLYDTDADNANGLIWVTGDEVVKEWSGDKTRARKYLLGEVEEFDQYLQGDVYGYVVEYQGEHVDSCWGFYGYKYALEEARSAGEAACKGETERRQEAARMGIPTL